MTTPLYRIKDWDAHFENSRTRQMDAMRWVPVPNKHDGDGLTALLDHRDAAAHYGAWHMILQVASKCRTRGTLLRDNGQPHDAKSLARMTRLPATVFEKVIPRLVGPDVAWLEVVDAEGVVTRTSPGRHPSDMQPTIEGKGREGNRIEGKGTTRPQATPAVRYGELGKVELSEAEYGKLIEKHGKARTLAGIELLDTYLGKKKKDPYASHYAALKSNSWVWERLDEKGDSAMGAARAGESAAKKASRQTDIKTLAELIRDGEHTPGATEKLRANILAEHGQDAIAEAERRATA